MPEAVDLLVVALGGNALSPPAGAFDYRSERAHVRRCAVQLRTLILRDFRLLVVHGNGPQVGRLLTGDDLDLDVHVAQTQGELGYLIAAALPEYAVACLMTRTLVGGDLGEPVKAIGPVLSRQPAAPARASAGGWRRLVPSPRPTGVVEADAIERLLATHHVIAGGGGGVPIGPDGRPRDCVVDKDWIASYLAVHLGAGALVFATDVGAVYRDVDGRGADQIDVLSGAEAERLFQAGVFGAGSMAPKVAAALEFAAATGKTARICSMEQIEAAVDGAAGTEVTSDG